MITVSAQEIRALLDLVDEDAVEQGSSVRSRSRDAVARRLPSLLLERYERLLASGRVPVVVAIEGGTCSGCHVRLPTMVAYRARSSHAIASCPNCKRMLYAPELLREVVRDPEDARPGRAGPRSAGRSS